MNPVKIPEAGGRKWKAMLITMGYVALMTWSVIALAVYMGCIQWNAIFSFAATMTGIGASIGGGGYVYGNVGEHKANATTRDMLKTFGAKG